MEKIVFVCINRTYRQFSSGIRVKGRESLYECTRKYWPLDPNRANEAEYVAGVCNGIIKTIYKRTENWKSVRAFAEFFDDAEVKADSSLLNRYAFTGIEAETEIKEKYINTRMPGRFYGIVSYNY